MSDSLLLGNSLLENTVLGRGLKFPLKESVMHGDFEGVVGEDNVKQCVLDLLETRVGERLMNEDLGTTLSASLFEDPEAVVDAVPFSVITLLTENEPRIRDVRAEAYAQERTVYVDVSWTVRATGQRSNLVFPFYVDPVKE